MAGKTPKSRTGKKGRAPEIKPARSRMFSPAWLILIGAGTVLLAAVLVYWVSRNTGTPLSRAEGTRQRSSPESKGKPSSEIKPQFGDFAGSQSCAQCHQKQFDLWKGSTHGQAGGEAHEAKIIARFDGKPLRFKDAVVTPTVNKKGEYVFILDRPGSPTTEIKVHAAVGGGHMYGGGTQSFFEKFSDGTIRFLPFDFIRRENLWFVQLRKDSTWVPINNEISLETDLANWMPNRVLGTLTEFSNCQNCHGSQIAAMYDEQNRKYETHYQTLLIDCESCHGPGKRHVEIVGKPGFEKQPEIGMEPLAALSKDRSLLVCFQCHATKDTIREEAYLPGADLESYFSLKLPVFAGTFTVDGRIRTFGYQSTHLYSDCYLNGSMTCVDCHDPHSQGYRDVVGKPLIGRFDNGQCTSCHASKAIAPELHSHHKSDSAGNRCTSCHMPFLQHQGIGTQLVFSRSDHSIPIPRPAFDQKIGIENACQKCHADKDLAWQEGKVKQWYGEIKPHHPMVANLIKASEAGDQDATAKLLLDPGARHPMAQMDGLTTYIKRFLRPNMDQVNPEVLAKLKAFARGNDLDLKALALMALHLAFDQQPEVRAFLDEQLKTMSNPGAVKDRWGIAADYFGNNYAGNGDMANASLCFKKSLEITPENVVTMSHLALAYLRSGDSENATVWLKNALKLKPGKAVLHFQLAQTYTQLRQIPQAIQELEEGLKYAPDDPIARNMLQHLRGM